MDIRFCDKLYKNAISDRKLKIIKKKVRRKSPKLNLFLITLPIGKQGILEVYWYPELLQSFYQMMDTKVTVVGLAYSRIEAFYIIKDMVEEIGIKDGKVLIEEFFEEYR